MAKKKKSLNFTMRWLDPELEKHLNKARKNLEMNLSEFVRHTMAEATGYKKAK